MRPAGRHAQEPVLLPADSPIRHPVVDDPRAMTRRAWSLAGLHLLLPGSVQLLAGDRRLGRFAIVVWIVAWIAVIVAVVTWLVAPAVLLAIPTTPGGLTTLQIALLAWGLLWLILTVDTIRLIGVGRLLPAARPAVVVLLAAALVVGTGGAAWGAYFAGITRAVTASVFGGQKAQAQAPFAGRFNILLIGGDTDTGSYRAATFSVLSIDESTGASTIIGVPKTLSRLPFPSDSPLKAAFPEGWKAGCAAQTCDLAGLYTTVQIDRRSLYPDATATGSTPGAAAVKDAVDAALGVKIQYTAVFDTHAFADLVDAIGGVDVTVPSAVEAGQRFDADGNIVGTAYTIHAGEQHLSGTRAAAYIRGPLAATDTGAMVRQRIVELAMVKQLNPADLLLKFQSIAAAGSTNIITDIPQDQLGRLAALAVKGRTAPVDTLELNGSVLPKPADPDYAAIQQRVAALIG